MGGLHATTERITASGTACLKITYAYVRWVLIQAAPSLSDAQISHSNCVVFGEQLRQRPSQQHGSGVFLSSKTQIKISPFLRCFPYRRSPSAYFEGTHGDRVAGDNTDAIDFVAIASSLRATNGRQALGNTNRLKAVSLVRGRK